MGTGDFICISMTGGAPWGFRLQGGKEQKQPLQVAKIRSQSKASGAGLCEGDEVVSINGSACADLTYPEVIQLMESITDSLQMLIRRPSGASEALLSESENKIREQLTLEGHVESTTLQIPPAAGPQGREQSRALAPADGGAAARGRTVELRLSLRPPGESPSLAPTPGVGGGQRPQAQSPGPSPAPSRSPSPDPIPIPGDEQWPQTPPPGPSPVPAPAPSPTPGDGQWPQTPPPGLQTALPDRAAPPPADAPRPGPDRSRPHRHRARHARLRRSESLSEKQVKEAKSKCKSIALLLTEAPNPSSKGVLMFKKRRRRARKYTLVSYGTGELEREAGEEEEEEEEGCREHACELAFLHTSESEADEDLPSDTDHSGQAVSFDWDSGLVDIEKKLESGGKMEMLPDTTGKGALMFAKRRERMDQITAQKEEGRASGLPGREAEAAHTDGLRATASYQSKAEESVRVQSSVSRSYIQLGQGPRHAPQQNGLGGVSVAVEAHRTTPMNRTAKPFPGPGNPPAAPFSPTRSVTSPISDFPAPPPYSAVTPPPDTFSRGVSSPVASPAQPPPWPQPAPWTQPAFYDSSERIASRDERIAVPAKRTGILQEAKRRSTTKPMFTFKEPKVSPNPELLSLLQNAEGKRGTGGDSGPEEDYLSLGAEACNFMQSPSAKQKTPPPVAPKPAVKSSSQPVTPVSPVWAPGAASTQPPAFPASNPPQGTVVSSIQIAQPSYGPARPASALNLAGPFKGPQAAVASQNYTPKPAAPAPAGGAAHTGAAGPSTELPGMSGKGAQLFAKRQSRMEKYVVDADTVQAHAARAQSPTPSLPAGWKYSSNIRAPPPVAYNPIHSPSYPLAALKSQPSAPQASRVGKKKGKKPLNALDVMKHQPYQLNAALFTFQPPGAKDGLPQKPPVKASPGPVLNQAPPPRPVPLGSPRAAQAPSVCSLPAYTSQPCRSAEPASPASASPVPVAVPASPRQEPASLSYFVAPRPKFSAKKSGVAVQASGRAFSLPGRPAPPALSTAPSWPRQPAFSYPCQTPDGLQRASKRPTPWEAAAQSPLGLVDDAFRPRNIQESVVFHVVSAARRKMLPGSPEGWRERLLHTQQAHVGVSGRQECQVASLASSSTSASSWCGPQAPYACRQVSRDDFETPTLETSSDYCLPATGCNYNPQPRAWRRQWE
ncbi:synaptopodin-2 isoform X2 [Sciurus carolinensis]|uniref:synaptopodin-2 isoform X2 n=1 Tax=Sciurus carolinensis TaxID=30640 RepID=UPI001FB39A9D|nr:synaptopodin-2 isoform X2 [Sciurus carolinensis]